ncbi:hypothetical protein NP493_691g02054 [Ridgeia piscesae]|uniref:Uncharacterized protein n=1 Tax=Ridgeia piscesae TaxID=27915 RepID=A0AAD9KRH1_RIDPI|nr:hypothetical protein NP493_691g02054 [Ridgeia piscesae]
MHWRSFLKYLFCFKSTLYCTPQPNSGICLDLHATFHTYTSQNMISTISLTHIRYILPVKCVCVLYRSLRCGNNVAYLPLHNVAEY